MPKLLIFTPCQHVLEDSITKDMSLITMVEGLTINLLPNSPDPPPGSTIPWAWCIFAKWARESSDTGKTFQQRVLLNAPDGTLIMELSPKEFSFTDDVNNRMFNVIMRFNNFPVAVQGICPLTLEYREAETERWSQVASFPLAIALVREQEKPPAAEKTVVWHGKK